MNKLMKVAPLLLTVVVVSGCSTIKSMHDWIIGVQRPTIVLDKEKYIRMFEAGRRAEAKGDIWKADYMYRQLISRGCRYGEYGRAKLLFVRGCDYEESVKCFLACAKRSVDKSDFSPDSAMDSAFSVAAGCELAVIAEQNERSDIAKVLREKMFDLKLKSNMDIMKWTYTIKTNDASRAIYMDVVSTVESCRPTDEYAKDFTWEDICKALVKGGDVTPGASVQLKSAWTEVRFKREPGTTLKYNFEYQIDKGNRPELGNWIRSVIRNRVRVEFQDANPNIDDFGIAFPVWDQSGSTITGSVVAASMKLSVEQIEYTDRPVRDGTTGHGKIVVRLGGSDVGIATTFAIQNIEELVARKGIANVVGQRPPPCARYKTRNEHMIEAGLLEIEFDTL